MKSPAEIEPIISSDNQPDFKAVKGQLPFRSFQEFQSAIADKKFNIGVDPLAAAEWSATQGTTIKRYLISALSILLILAAIAAIIVAIFTQNYWLLLALPIQAAVFYLANSNTAIRLWVTVAGVVSLIYFFNLLLNEMPTAATLVAYGGLTFAAVRASSSLTNAAFRKALVKDQALFVEAFINRACTLRDNKTKQVYECELK
jgi:hypothetical protein